VFAEFKTNFLSKCVCHLSGLEQSQLGTNPHLGEGFNGKFLSFCQHLPPGMQGGTYHW